MNRPQIFAHRGAKSVAPENTLPAFQAALDMGVDGIELDVHLSRDRQLVVIHDFTVDKTTDGSGPVGDFSAAQLAGLDAGSHFAPEFAGVGVPTLDQVLDLVGNRCIVNIEIKSQAATGGEQVEPVLAAIRERRLWDQVIVSSFNPVTLIALRSAAPRVQLGLLYSEQIPAALLRHWMSPLINPQALHPHFSLVDAALCRTARGEGRAVNTWTVNCPERARELAALGVSVIMSDVPDRIMAALQDGAGS